MLDFSERKLLELFPGSKSLLADIMVTSVCDSWWDLHDKTWFVIDVADSKVTLTITHLDLEPLSNCSHDYIEVLDGNDLAAPQVSHTTQCTLGEKHHRMKDGMNS